MILYRTIFVSVISCLLCITLCEETEELLSVSPDIIHVTESTLILGNNVRNTSYPSQWTIDTLNHESIYCSIQYPDICIYTSSDNPLHEIPTLLLFYENMTVYNFNNDTEWNSVHRIKSIPQYLDPLDDPSNPHRRRRLWGALKRAFNRVKRGVNRVFGGGRRPRRRRRRRRRKSNRRSRRRRRRKKRKKTKLEREFDADDRQYETNRHIRETRDHFETKKMMKQLRRWEKREQRQRKEDRELKQRPPFWWFHPKRGPAGPRGVRGHTGRRGPRGIAGKSGVGLFRGFFRGVRHALNEPPQNSNGKRWSKFRGQKANEQARYMSGGGGDGVANMGNLMGKMMMKMMNDNSGYGGYGGYGGSGGGGRKRPSLVIHTHRYVNPMYNSMNGMPFGMMYGRRRMIEDQTHPLIDYAENIEHGVGVEKCVVLDGMSMKEICVRYDYVDRQFTVKYLQYMEKREKSQRMDMLMDEWTMKGIDVGDQQIYECNDNFEDLQEMCVVKWRLYDDDVHVIVRGDGINAEQEEYSLMDDSLWESVYFVNEETKRLCRQILDGKMMCAELKFEPDSNQIVEITRISVSVNV